MAAALGAADVGVLAGATADCAGAPAPGDAVPAAPAAVSFVVAAIVGCAVTCDDAAGVRLAALVEDRASAVTAAATPTAATEPTTIVFAGDRPCRRRRIRAVGST